MSRPIAPRSRFLISNYENYVLNIQINLAIIVLDKLEFDEEVLYDTNPTFYNV